MDRQNLITAALAIVIKNYLKKDSIEISAKEWNEFIDSNVNGISIGKDEDKKVLEFKLIESDENPIEELKSLVDTLKEVIEGLED